jgi:putative hydrolase of the HAD superfamily
MILSLQRKLSGIKAVFFDAGNTLLCPHPSVEAVCAAVLKRYGFNVPFEQLSIAVQKADRLYEELYREDDTFWGSEEKAAELWRRLYNKVIQEIGIDGKTREAIAKEIYEEFGGGNCWQVYPDVTPALKALKKKRLKLGLISNWDSRLPDICFSLGLGEYLDFIVCSAVIGRIKPEPNIFEVALKRAGVSAKEAIHVGDHYYADIMGARSVGLIPVLISRHSPIQKADCLVIKDLSELVEMIL